MIVATSIVRRLSDRIKAGLGTPGEDELKGYIEEAVLMAELFMECSEDDGPTAPLRPRDAG